MNWLINWRDVSAINFSRPYEHSAPVFPVAHFWLYRPWVSANYLSTCSNINTLNSLINIHKHRAYTHTNTHEQTELSAADGKGEEGGEREQRGDHRVDDVLLNTLSSLHLQTDLQPDSDMLNLYVSMLEYCQHGNWSLKMIKSLFRHELHCYETVSNIEHGGILVVIYGLSAN